MTISELPLQLLDVTLPTVQENLALDEALLDEAEDLDVGSNETLRLWSPPDFAVIIGRNSQIAVEVDHQYCHDNKIPILRRSSGGATVVIGPGCLMYSVILSYHRRPHLRDLSATHEFVLGRIARAIPGSRLRGTSDLAIGEKKIAGNSLRCKRNHFLYHGTLLLNFPLHVIAQALKMPPRQPDYRRGRSHEDFVANCGLPEEDVRKAIIDAWKPTETRTIWPEVDTTCSE